MGHKPSQNISEAGQAVVLSWAVFGLRELGRLLEAAEKHKAEALERIKNIGYCGG
ncbi:MAG: hypothetical protein OHK0019_32650 [Saprospiraceae bacterium]